MTTKTLLTTVAAFTCVALPSIGQIITPSAATSATGSLSNRPIEETINGNGLSNGGTSGDVLSETHNVNAGNSGEYWIGTLSGAALTFTLPAASTVDTVHLWTYSRTGETDRGISSFDISFSADGTTFGTPIPVTGVAAGNFPNPIVVQSFSFASQTGVTHIRLDNIVNHGDGSFVGLSEIRFGATGAVDADTSTVDAAPSAVLADGTATSTITVTLKDGGGAPVAGKLVTLAGDTGNATIAPAATGSDTTNASGAATFTVFSTTVETETFTATGDSVVITGTASVEFLDPAVNASLSTVSASPITILADGTSTSAITVSLRNSSDVPLPGKLVTLVGDTGNAIIETAGAGTDTTDASGVATFTVKSATVETETFTATGDTVPIVQAASVAFTSLDFDNATSAVSASPSTVIADGSSTSIITVTLRNSAGLPLAGKLVGLSGDTGNATIEAAGVGTDTTDANGDATFTVKSGTPETETFTATADSVALSATAAVAFVTPDPQAVLAYEPFDYIPGSDVNTPLAGGIGFTGQWAPGQQGGVITVYDAASAVGVINGNAGGEIEWDGVVDNVPTTPAGGSNRYISSSPTTVNATDRITALRSLSQSAGALAGPDKTLWASVVWHQQGSNFGRHVGFALGTDGLSNRSANVDNSGDAIGVGGAFNTGLVTPVIYNNGNITARTTTGATSVSFSEDNLVVLKFTFADGAEADTVSAYRFTESDLLSEATFNTNAISASAVIDQDTLTVLSFSQSRGEEAIDEIRLGSTFDDVISAPLALITDFEAAGSAGVIDPLAKTITVEVPFGTDLSTLAPTFTLSSGTCDPTSGTPPSPTFAVQNPATYTVTDTSTDPATVNAYTVTVTEGPKPPVALVIDLGAGTTIEGGEFVGSGPTNLPLPSLPTGSILRSITFNSVTLTATDNGSDGNFASDLTVLLDPTPGTPGGDFVLGITGTGANQNFGITGETLFWNGGGGGVGTSISESKTDADWAATGEIDLATTGIFLGNGYRGVGWASPQGGTWTGTITLTYDDVGTGTSYASWSGGEGAEADTNGDGVPNAVAYALGAADVGENVIGLLPTFDNSDPNNFVFTFDRSDAAEADATTTITVEYGTTLSGWTTAPNAGDGVTVDDSGASVGGLTPIVVTIPKALATDGRLFARLKVVVSP